MAGAESVREVRGANRCIEGCPVTLAEVNACDRGGFVDRLGWVFEHSPWVAGQAGDEAVCDAQQAALQ
jgi:2-oxo-4-hydroxy-4-carboxy--5-ureidoimidazoline (OHCU) decarboxylase